MRQATKWFNILTTRVPTDPGILARLGQIYSREEDEAQAFHYHLEAYRYFPVNMEVISWLGAYFVKNELYEKAMQFFERAAQIQPEEVKVRVRRSLQQQCCFVQRVTGGVRVAVEAYGRVVPPSHPELRERSANLPGYPCSVP